MLCNSKFEYEGHGMTGVGNQENWLKLQETCLEKFVKSHEVNQQQNWPGQICVAATKYNKNVPL